MGIRRPEAHRLAREVAELTGESVTGAVTEPGTGSAVIAIVRDDKGDDFGHTDVAPA